MAMPDNSIFWWGNPLKQLKSAITSKQILRVWVVQLERKDKHETAILDFDGIRGECSSENFDKHEFSTIKGFVGHQVDVCILNVDEQNNTFSASRKDADAIKAKNTLRTIEEGKRYTGTISGWNPKSNTVFIDIGGIDGFCYLSDWDYKDFAHVQDVGEIGQPVEVFVKSIIVPKEKSVEGKDTEGMEQFIRLSKKELQQHPWKQAEKKFPEGNIVLGKVVGITDKAVFVELEKGLTVFGVIPKRVNLPNPVIGQPVRGKIAFIDQERKRGRIIINGYPHGAINRNDDYGSYIFE